jgi:hypothetical protein
MAASISSKSVSCAKWISTFAALLAVVPACSKKPSEPAAATAPVAQAAAAPAPAPADPIAHGTRKLKNLDVPVFVDGKQVAVLRYGELPSQVALAENPADGTHEKRYYRLYEYLKAIGVDVDHVKAVHLAGTRDHLASLEGSELRAEKGRFVFNFLEGDTGIANLRWDTTGLKSTLRIDEIYAINVFVANPVRAIDEKKHCYLESENECTPVARFGEGDMAKGTRVYVDGKMVSYVKRRLLTDGIVAGKTADGDSQFSIDKYLASLGVNAASVKTVDMLAGDDIVARASGSEWAKDRDALVFTLPKHSHGKARVSVPADLQAKGGNATDRGVTVTSIKIYRTTNPPSRALTAIDDVIDVGALPNATEQQAALVGPGGHERDNE